MINTRYTGILLDPETGDLYLSDDRLAIGNTTYQNQYLLLKCQKGDLKRQPDDGVGIDDFLGDESGDLELKKEVRVQFERDQLEVDSIVYKNSNLDVKAAYV